MLFFHHAATPEIYTLSLHDALPILERRSARPVGRDARSRRRTDRPWSPRGRAVWRAVPWRGAPRPRLRPPAARDRKSTRLNSSHTVISYAVFCLKKKK